MQLIEIHKKRYRKHLNIIIISFIASLLVLSLTFGAVLISLFSNIGDVTALVTTTTSNIGAEPETNFKYNLLGVILALLANAAVMHSLRKGQYFTEVYYVWRVKQLQNLIYRKINKIKAGAKAGEENALIILAFYYQSQIQVYELDDNTITLSSIKLKHAEVLASITELGLDVSSEQFDKELIKLY